MVRAILFGGPEAADSYRIQGEDGSSRLARIAILDEATPGEIGSTLNVPFQSGWLTFEGMLVRPSFGIITYELVRVRQGVYEYEAID